MSGYIDLHCHCVPGIDDGARNLDESDQILTALAQLGFARVVATPHMRPGMFDNTRDDLFGAYESFLHHARRQPNWPNIELSSEHYFDDVVFGRIMSGTGVPYPGRRAILLEFYSTDFPLSIDHRLADIRRSGLIPVIAHPERYEPLWKDPEILERLLDVGCVALLDAGALIGRYGRKAQKCARAMLERGLYRAACSDAHRLNDVQATAKSIAWITEEYGREEVDELFLAGPEAILAGHGLPATRGAAG